MPKYRVELEDGRKFDVVADSQPTEAEVLAQLGEEAAPPAAPTATPATPEPAAPPSPAAPPAPSYSSYATLRPDTKGAGTALWELLKGAALEAPLVAERAAGVIPSAAGSAVEAGLKALGFKGAAERLAATNAAGKAAVEKPFTQAPDASTAEKVGRMVTRAAPQVALAAATGGASLPAQAAIQGAAGTAQTAAEGGTPGEIVGAGLLSAAAPLAGPALGKTAGWVSKTLTRRAIDLYNRALHPSGDAMKELAEKTAPRMVNEGLTAGPVEGLRTLGSTAEKELDPLGKAIQRTYEEATAKGIKMNGEKLADALDPLKLPYVDTVAVSARAPEGVFIKDPLIVGKIEEVQDALRTYGKEATPNQLWGYRKTLDAVIKRTGGFLNKVDEDTLKGISRKIRGNLADALVDATKSTTPNIAGLNRDYAFYSSIRDLVRATTKRQIGQQRTGELVLKYGAGMLGGGLYGGHERGARGIGEGALAGATTVAVLRSPFARTWRAKEMNALADMLLGNAKILSTPAGKTVATTLALFGVRAVTQPAESPEPESPDESVSPSEQSGAQPNP